MTEEKKIEYYDNDWYVVQVPPVPTSYWEKADWIRFSDNNGHWIKGVK